MPWCLTHRITGVPPSVSVALKIALRSLDLHGNYNNTRLLELKHIRHIDGGSDFKIPWCLTHRITGAPTSVSVPLKIALRSLEHHAITITLAYSR